MVTRLLLSAGRAVLSTSLSVALLAGDVAAQEASAERTGGTPGHEVGTPDLRPDPRPFYTREIHGIPPPLGVPPMTIEGQFQFRYAYSNRNREDMEHTTGFQFRRARIGVEGALNEWIVYSVEGAFGRSDGQFRLNDAAVMFNLDDESALKVGRFRPHFYREEDVSSKRQILVDRSILQAAFGLPRTLGVEGLWEGESLRGSLGYADQSEDFGPDEDFVYTFRAEALLAGEWSDFKSFSADLDQELGVMIGGGLLYLDTNLRPGEEPEGDILGNIFRWTLDASVMYRGWSGFVAVIGSQGGEDEEGVGVNQYGFLAQGAWRLDEAWELAARYEYGDADQMAKDLAIVTFGVNYYIADHALKWQNDIGFALNEVNGFWSSTSRGWLTDRSGNDGQIVFRSQVQFLF